MPGKIGKVYGRSGKSMKVKNVKIANPAIIHSNQAESDLPKWAS